MCMIKTYERIIHYDNNTVSIQSVIKLYINILQNDDHLNQSYESKQTTPLEQGAQKNTSSTI